MSPPTYILILIVKLYLINPAGSILFQKHKVLRSFNYNHLSVDNNIRTVNNTRVPSMK